LLLLANAVFIDKRILVTRCCLAYYLLGRTNASAL